MSVELDELLDTLGRRGPLEEVLQPGLELLGFVREREVYPPELREHGAGGRDPARGFLVIAITGLFKS